MTSVATSIPVQTGSFRARRDRKISAPDFQKRSLSRTRRILAGSPTLFAALAATTAGISSTEAIANASAIPTPVITRAMSPLHVGVDRNSDLSSQIISYRGLEPDWDGDDAAVPTDAAIDAALAFIDLLPLDSSPNGAMVESNGQVGFYWNTPEAYIDITFDGAKIIYYAKCVTAGGGQPHEAMGENAFNGRYLPSDLLLALTLA